MHEHDASPPSASHPVDFGEIEQLRPPPRALASASRTENEVCDTLLKVGMESPLNQPHDEQRPNYRSQFLAIRR
jgi:hypothetical protein